MRLERARLQAFEQDVLLDAVTVYTDLLAAQAVLDFADPEREPAAPPAAGDPGPLRGRRGHPTDVAQADARLSGATADRVQAEGACRGEAEYRRVINQEPGRLVVPQPLRAAAGQRARRSSSREVGNPNIVAAQFDLAAARAEVDVARRRSATAFG